MYDDSNNARNELESRRNENIAQRTSLMNERDDLIDARRDIERLFDHHSNMVNDVRNTHRRIMHNRFRGNQHSTMLSHIDNLQCALSSQMTIHNNHLSTISRRITALNGEIASLTIAINTQLTQITNLQ
jgi:uncharacterized protein (DUF3084 family)